MFDNKIKKSLFRSEQGLFYFAAQFAFKSTQNVENFHIEQLYQLYQQHPTIVTDSRKVEPGCLFFALKGENFNGNHFVQQALEAGAAFAVADEPQQQGDPQIILVGDVLTTLQQLATHHRRQFNIPVLAITGSNGKTTTKELVSSVLASHYPTHFTKGNFNNHIGVPLTLLAMPLHTEVAVIEMGANHQGEIDFLCRIAEPTHGLITNVGKAHLEGFGGLEGVKKGKGELYKYLAAHKGIAFVNSDEPNLTEMAIDNRLKLFYHKSDAPSPTHAPFEVKLISESPYLSVAFLNDTQELETIQSSLVGRYNFNNIMTAITVGKYFKVPAAKIKAAIAGYMAANNRSQIVRIGDNTFLLDAYNANPTSMANALEAFSKMKADHKIAILGAMRELGAYSDKEHLDIAALADSLGLDKIVLVGAEFEAAAKLHGFAFFSHTAELKDWYKKNTFHNTHFLMKGSRGIGLEKMLEDELPRPTH